MPDTDFRTQRLFTPEGDEYVRVIFKATVTEMDLSDPNFDPNHDEPNVYTRWAEIVVPLEQVKWTDAYPGDVPTDTT